MYTYTRRGPIMSRHVLGDLYRVVPTGIYGYGLCAYDLRLFYWGLYYLLYVTIGEDAYRGSSLVLELVTTPYVMFVCMRTGILYRGQSIGEAGLFGIGPYYLFRGYLCLNAVLSGGVRMVTSYLAYPILVDVRHAGLAGTVY